MENKEYGQVIGSPEAPYINALAARYGLATAFYGTSHPSLPNYLALTGGSTFGISSDCTTCSVDATNLVDQLAGHGISWKAYMQGMPHACYPGATYGEYAKRHDPFMYFDDVRTDPSRCGRIVPFTQLGKDIAAGALPRFVWITPDVCQDMHDCPVATGDAFLKTLVPRLLPTLGTNGVLFLTWDEGTSDLGCCGGLARGGHIATIVAGPTVRPVSRLAGPFDHYSILKTIEQSWGLPLLRGAADPATRSLGGFFGS